MGPNDGCFVQPKHVAAIGFAVINVARRWAYAHIIANYILYSSMWIKIFGTDCGKVAVKILAQRNIAV